ncbi:MAG: hypothetical protein AB7G11_06320 [Phycisphaerales bacterium]
MRASIVYPLILLNVAHVAAVAAMSFIGATADTSPREQRLALAAGAVLMLLDAAVIAGLLIPACKRTPRAGPHYYSPLERWLILVPASVFGLIAAAAFSEDLKGFGLASACSAPSALAAMHVFFSRHKRIPGQCDECGYSLAGLHSGTCPECGASFLHAIADKQVK